MKKRYTKRMEPEEKKNDPEFSVTLRNGALDKLKQVASDLGIPEDRMGDVLIKGLSLIDVAKEGTAITIKKGKEEYVIDLRRL